MKGFIKMTRDTWKFYLGVLGIVLFLVMLDTLYLCAEDNSDYQGKMFCYQMDEDSREGFLAKNAGYFDGGKDMTIAVMDKIFDYEPLGYISTIIILLLILWVKQFAFMDQRAMEFQAALPVKKVAGVLHDYLSILGILLLGEVLQGGMLLAYQTNYNRKMIETARAFAVTDIKEGIVSQTNANLLLYMGFYVFLLVLIYTWIYLGMTVTKNPIAGSLISLYIWWRVVPETKSILSPFEFFEERRGITGVYSPVQAACIMAGFLLGIFLLIVAAASKREPSKGKLFYFPELDYPFSLFVGAVAGMYLIDSADLGNEAVYVFGVIISVVTCLVIHPFSNKKPMVWEVK